MIYIFVCMTIFMKITTEECYLDMPIREYTHTPKRGGLLTILRGFKNKKMREYNIVENIRGYERIDTNVKEKELRVLIENITIEIN